MSRKLRIAMLLNEASEPKAGTATEAILEGLIGRGHQVLPIAIDDLGLADAGPRLRLVGGSTLESGDLDLVISRTSPGRDLRRGALHDFAIQVLHQIEARGCPVLNPPAVLDRWRNKAALFALPATLRPQGLVCSRPEEAIDQIRASRDRWVMKPLAGTRGRGVVQVTAGSDNLLQLAELLAEGGPIMVQRFVKGHGDTRVIFLDGRPLRIDGRLCAVARRPGLGDFRSNVHAGGRAEAPEIDDDLLAAVDRLGEHLHDGGLWLAGADFVGTKLVELNVHAPGGLGEASAFAGVDFLLPVLESIEKRSQR